MNKNEILEIGMKLISTNQQNCCCADDKETLIYTTAYNDGIMDMVDKLSDICGNDNHERGSS